MVPIPSKRFLTFLAPSFLLIEPVATKELSDARVIGLLLGRFKGYELVEILIDRRWIA